MVSLHDPISCMWRCSCCWEPQDMGRKPWLSSIATAHQWDELSLQLRPKKHNYGSLSSFSEDPASTPQAATLWEPCWDCLCAIAQELWMDHNDTSHWVSCCGSPARSGRAVGSTALKQSRLSCVQHFCHTDQHSWHGVWASIKLYLWSETAWQTPSHEARQCKAIAHQSFFSLGKIILCKTDALHHAAVPFLAG